MNEEGRPDFVVSIRDSWRFPDKFSGIQGQGTFMQESGCGFDADFPMEQRLKQRIHQQIADGNQDHALVVGHPGVHDFKRSLGITGRGGTFHGFVESKTSHPPAIAHVTEILQRR